MNEYNPNITFTILVGGLNPSEQYARQIGSSPEGWPPSFVDGSEVQLTS